MKTLIILVLPIILLRPAMAWRDADGKMQPNYYGYSGQEYGQGQLRQQIDIRVPEHVYEPKVIQYPKVQNPPRYNYEYEGYQRWTQDED